MDTIPSVVCSATTQSHGTQPYTSIFSDNSIVFYVNDMLMMVETEEAVQHNVE